LKHQQNLRASEKRGLPYFNLELAMRLLNGHFHEEDEDEEEFIVEEDDKAGGKETTEKAQEAHLAQMKKFEDALK
jgi:hypothetical protein